MRSKTTVGIIAIAILAGAAWCIYAYAASAHFARALADAHFSGHIEAGGRAYTIEDGALRATGGGRIAPWQRFGAYRLAYALALAERDPVFGIAGTNPAALATSTAALSRSVRGLAAAQTNAADAAAIERLYPIAFLTALSSAEEARLRFIGSGRDTDAAAYRAALAQTARAGAADTLAFQAALDAKIGTSTLRLLSYGGTITDDTLRAAADAAHTRMSEAEAQIRQRTRCLDGITLACDADWLTTPLPAAFQNAGKTPQTLDVALNTRASAEYDSVSLGKSACLSSLPGPYAFKYGSIERSGRIPLTYFGDYFFSPTAGQDAGTMSYLRDTLSIRYSLVNPLEFYICPDVGTDFSSARFVIDTVQFARAHPTLAPHERSALLKEKPYSSSRALSYLRTALESAVDPADLRSLEELALECEERSAGLEAIVRGIVTTDEQDLALARDHIPIDIDARTLFITHSAFPSLFLMQNPAAGSTSVSLRDTTQSGEQRTLAAHVLSFRALSKTVPTSELIRDVDAYLEFETSDVLPAPTE